MRFTKVFRTELGHKYILVECSVIALCLLVVSQHFPVINSCAINRTMIGMSIKRISVLNLCHVLKPFVKSTPEDDGYVYYHAQQKVCIFVFLFLLTEYIQR